MRHASLVITAFGLWFLVGCRWKSPDDNGVPPQPPPQPQAPQANVAPVEELREPTTKSLIQAAALGNVNDVKAYVRRDPESVRRPNATGFYPIHIAADQGRSEVIWELLRAGADVNMPHANVQATPLQYAAMKGQVEAVQTLLAAGARIDAVDRQGRTPLMWAAWKGQTQVVQELLKHGADARCTTKAGWTALRYAEQNGNAQVTALLRK